LLLELGIESRRQGHRYKRQGIDSQGQIRNSLKKRSPLDPLCIIPSVVDKNQNSKLFKGPTPQHVCSVGSSVVTATNSKMHKGLV
jgi:hypothetical protein